MIYFTEDEFPEELFYASEDLLTNLDTFRSYLDKEIYPSPVPGALARFDHKSVRSEHYAVNRLSRAVDIFCNADPFETYCKLLESKLFPRIGVYFDTMYRNKPWFMFHVDLKDKHLTWFRDKRVYYYSYQPGFYNWLLERFKNI